MNSADPATPAAPVPAAAAAGPSVLHKMSAPPARRADSAASLHHTHPAASLDRSPCRGRSCFTYASSSQGPPPQRWNGVIYGDIRVGPLAPCDSPPAAPHGPSFFHPSFYAYQQGSPHSAQPQSQRWDSGLSTDSTLHSSVGSPRNLGLEEAFVGGGGYYMGSRRTPSLCSRGGSSQGDPAECRATHALYGTHGAASGPPSVLGDGGPGGACDLYPTAHGGPSQQHYSLQHLIPRSRPSRQEEPPPVVPPTCAMDNWIGAYVTRGAIAQGGGRRWAV